MHCIMHSWFLDGLYDWFSPGPGAPALVPVGGGSGVLGAGGVYDAVWAAVDVACPGGRPPALMARAI